MKCRHELQTLLKIKHACEEAAECAQSYNEYKDSNLLSLDARKETALFQKWYSALSNIITAVLESGDVFKNCSSLWQTTVAFLRQQVIIPDKLKSYFSNVDDLSLARVLKIARNHHAHPDKTNQEQYLYLADCIPHQLLMQAFYKICELLEHEWQTLTDEELRLMIAESAELKRNILSIQKELERLIPLIETDPRVTPGARKQFMDFLEFVPDASNVFIDKTLNNNGVEHDQL